MTDNAMADSVRRVGKVITPSAARLNVIECAIVNAVTIWKTSQNAGLNRSTGASPDQPRLRHRAARARNQHRRQQQRQQEQDVVEAHPDVPYAFATVVEELHQAAGPRELETLARGFRAENRRARASQLSNAAPTTLVTSPPTEPLSSATTNGKSSNGVTKSCPRLRFIPRKDSRQRIQCANSPAITNYRLGEPKQAREWLTKATANPAAASQSDYGGMTWDRRLTSQLLGRRKPRNF